MFVRIAVFEGVDMDAGTGTADEVRERVAPLFENMDGFKGYLDLADRSSGKMMSLSFFESEETMRAAEPVFDEDMPRAIGPEIMQGFTGRRTAVERYEVVDQERISI
jgi:hypothetical protein